MMRKLLATILTSALMTQFATATTYHIAQSENASDNNAGTHARPWRTIGRSLDQLQPGDTVLIHPGTYRQWVAPEVSGTRKKPITFKGTDRQKVVLTGADVIQKWQPLQGANHIYTHKPWTARFQISKTEDGRPVYHHPHNEKHTVIGRPEQVIVDGNLLRQVIDRDDMNPGTFFADLHNDRLLVWLKNGADPRDHKVQASTRGWVFGYHPWRNKGKADYIHLQNFTVRYAANHAQRGAIWVGGDGWRLQNITVEYTAGNGVSMAGRGLRVKNLISRYNGQMGIGGSPKAAIIDGVKLLQNNRLGFNPGWEAGGMKFAHCRDIVLSNVEAVGNDGPGIWFDIDNRDCIVRRCTCHHNTGHGIFIEISGACIITNNLCHDNGLADHWSAAGICIAESEDCIVEHNTCVNNPTGISIREQGPRAFSGVFKDVSYRVRNFVCQYNLCAYNDRYQFGLWADNIFFGPHPSPNADKGAVPLDPDKANFRIDHNLYYAEDDAQLVLWGCPWRKKHTKYDKLTPFRSEHGHDEHTVVAKPQFTDFDGGEFRLRAESPAARMGAGAISLLP